MRFLRKYLIINTGYLILFGSVDSAIQILQKSLLRFADVPLINHFLSFMELSPKVFDSSSTFAEYLSPYLPKPE